MKIIIPLNPVPKKNSQEIRWNRRTRKPYIGQGDRYIQYEAAALWYIKRPDKPIDYPVEVKCLFYRKTRHRVDLTNLLEAIDDILVKAGVLADDNSNIIVSHDG